VRRNLNPERTQNQSQNQNPSIVSIVGGMGTLQSFASGGSARRGCLESLPERTGTAPLMVCLILGWFQEVRVWCVPSTLVRGVSLCREVSHHIDKVVGVLGLGVVSLLDVPLLVPIKVWGNDHSFRSERSCGPWSPLRGTRSPPRVRVGVPPRSDRMDFANPMFEKMARNWFDSFCTNPVLSLLLTLALVFHFAGRRHGGLLVDRHRLLSTHDQRSTVVLQPHPGDDQGVHHFWG
jgi:hypothetical protein